MVWLIWHNQAFLSEGLQAIRNANNLYLLLALLCAILAMFAQAEVMVILLRSAGVALKRRSANSLGLQANAVSVSFPGGPVLSAAMIFREQMKWGATPVIASWYALLSGAIGAAGLAVLALSAILFLGLKVQWSTVTISCISLLLLAYATNWVARNPQKVEKILQGFLRKYNRWRKKPEQRWEEKVTSFTQQLRVVDLSPLTLARSIVASFLNWVMELLCLVFCIYAIGAEPTVAGVILSFVAAKIVGTLQVTPGGLGSVDVTLTGTLISLGSLASTQAIAATFLFRLLSFVFIALIGWLIALWSRILTSRSSKNSQG